MDLLKQMEKMGFKGKGLGKHNGITQPITMKVKTSFNQEEKRKTPDNEPVFMYILSDSILNQMDETRLSREKKNVKVKWHGGCNINHMYEHLPSAFKAHPKYLLLHISTNDSKMKTSDEILSELNKLKEYIEKKMPKCTVIISLPTRRNDST